MPERCRYRRVGVSLSGGEDGDYMTGAGVAGENGQFGGVAEDLDFRRDDCAVAIAFAASK